MFYHVLNINPNKTRQDVKRAFNRLVVSKHPDKGGDVASFMKLREAYETLSDVDKRNEYDRETFPYESSITINLKELRKLRELKDLFKTVTYRKPEVCNYCEGHGGTNVIECLACAGDGLNCISCNGVGSIILKMCDKCHGAKTMLVEHVYEIKVPFDVEENRVFIFEEHCLRIRFAFDLPLGLQIDPNGDLRIQLSDITLTDLLCGFVRKVDIGLADPITIQSLGPFDVLKVKKIDCVGLGPHSSRSCFIHFTMIFDDVKDVAKHTNAFKALMDRK